MRRYYELRTMPTQQTPPLGADIARHLQARQNLGSAVVVCDSPVALLSVARKQWLHLTRTLQRQRASTLNPEEILRLTHTIMHMHHIQFVAKAPGSSGEPHIYFITPQEFSALPANCHSVYLCRPIGKQFLQKITKLLPENGLIINYDVGLSLSTFGLRPKSELEARVLRDWQEMANFLRLHRIKPGHFAAQDPSQYEALDDALDTLLGCSHEFLRLAALFRQSIHLAQPLTTIDADQQHIFTAVMRLAHRVQALSPDSFNNYLLKTFGEKDSYFLRDSSSQNISILFFGLPCVAADYEQMLAE